MFPLYDDNPIQRTPVATYALVAVNVLVFLWMIRMPELPRLVGVDQRGVAQITESREVLAYQLGFVPARMTLLSQRKPLQVPVEVLVRYSSFGQQFDQKKTLPIQLEPAPRQIWLSLLTCMFLHGSWWHLLGNMWFLFLFGDNVEDRLGSLLYLFLYFLGGVIASVSHWVVEPTSALPVIGASGAIAAVLGGYAITWPWARVRTLVILIIFVTIIDVPALVMLGVWFVGQLVAGQQSLREAGAGGVAWWAHIGGFVAGVVLMPLLSALVGGAKNEDDTIEN